MKPITRFRTGGLILMSVALLGCGGSTPGPKADLIPVSGTVKLGGRPMAGIQVAFVPIGSTAGQGAFAVTDDAGVYDLVHNATRLPGIGAGEYVVQFTKWVQPDGSPLPEKTAPHMVNAVNLIPPGWGGGGDAWPQTQIKVSPATTKLDFDIPAR
jgi:hypothetical protein